MALLTWVFAKRCSLSLPAVSYQNNFQNRVDWVNAMLLIQKHNC